MLLPKLITQTLIFHSYAAHHTLEGPLYDSIVRHTGLRHVTESLACSRLSLKALSAMELCSSSIVVPFWLPHSLYEWRNMWAGELPATVVAQCRQGSATVRIDQ